MVRLFRLGETVASKKSVKWCWTISIGASVPFWWFKRRIWANLSHSDHLRPKNAVVHLCEAGGNRSPQHCKTEWKFWYVYSFCFTYWIDALFIKICSYTFERGLEDRPTEPRQRTKSQLWPAVWQRAVIHWTASLLFHTVDGKDSATSAILIQMNHL